MDYYVKQRNPNTFNYSNSENKELMKVMEYLKILESLPRGWDKDAHYHLFCLIYIWMKLLGFGYRNSVSISKS
jgi:hypothetical protein